MPYESQLQLAPLGSGDLIDRSVRLYRRHLSILIRIAAPPVVVAAAGWILLSLSFRQLILSSETAEAITYILLLLLGIGIISGGYLLTLVVMGGATRNLVAHLLRNDPVSVRATYQAVRSRFWGLVGASILILFWIILSAIAALTVSTILSYVLLIIIAVGTAVGASLAPWFSVVVTIVSIIVTIIGAIVSLIVFFFIVGRAAYVPQVMLVEGRGIFDAFARSFALAKGNVRRLMAMTLFTTFATNSAVMILLVPLSWYGYLSGVEVMNSVQWPAWYAIAYSVIGTLSSILLAPVWMLGLSLLYVDERVRHEGYDIELMASRQLGELPDINVTSPFGTALSSEVRRQPPPSPPMSSGSVLNLR